MKPHFTVIVVLLFVTTITTKAQTPNQQVGVGVSVWQNRGLIDGGAQ